MGDNIPVHSERGISPHEAKANREVWVCLCHLVKDPEIREQFLFINEYAQTSEQKLERKQRLFDLLKQLGLQTHLAVDGYFPYEPVYYFWPEQIREHSDYTKENLLKWNQKPEKLDDWPTRIFLEDIRSMIKQALR